MLQAPRRFDLVGLRWAAARTSQAQVRARARGGRWTRWTALATRAHGPVDGTDPPSPAPPTSSSCGCAGSASELKARFVRAPPARPRAARPRRQAGAPRDRPARGLGRRPGPAARRPELRRGAGRVRPPHGRRDRLRAPRNRPGSCSASPATTATPTAGTTSATTSSSTATAWSSRAARAASRRPSIGAQAQGCNSYSTGIACLGTFTDMPLDEPGDGGAGAADRLEALAPRRARRRAR